MALAPLLLAGFFLAFLVVGAEPPLAESQNEGDQGPKAERADSTRPTPPDTKDASDMAAAVAEEGGPDSPEAANERGVLDREQALRRDARAYAEDFGVSEEEALRRLQLQDAAGDLDKELTEKERATFAGLYIDNGQEYRVVALFTEGGQEKVRPYVEGGPLEGLVEVEPADVTLEELEAIQEGAGRAAEEDLRVPHNTSINVETNSVELITTAGDSPSQERLDSALRAKGVNRPDKVDRKVVDRLAEPGTNGAGMSSPSGILFPKRQESRVEPLALTGGVLFVDGSGCLRLNQSLRGGGTSTKTPVWPPGYELAYGEGGELLILDEAGEVVAKVGDEVRMGGGEYPIEVLPNVDERTRRELAERCPGPYWWVGSEVRVVAEE